VCYPDKDEYCTTEVALDVSGNVTKNNSGCVTNKCDWSTLKYDPPALYGNEICIGDDDKYYTCNNNNISSSTKTSYSIAGTKDTCGMGDCSKRLEEKGIKNAVYEPTTGKCKSIIRCDTATGTDEACGKCPMGETNQSCCREYDTEGNYTYTGQICKNNAACWDSSCQNSSNIKNWPGSDTYTPVFKDGVGLGVQFKGNSDNKKQLYSFISKTDSKNFRGDNMIKPNDFFGNDKNSLGCKGEGGVISYDGKNIWCCKTGNEASPECKKMFKNKNNIKVIYTTSGPVRPYVISPPK
jgi:hypothetical protein